MGNAPRSKTTETPAPYQPKKGMPAARASEFYTEPPHSSFLQSMESIRWYILVWHGTIYGKLWHVLVHDNR